MRRAVSVLGPPRLESAARALDDGADRYVLVFQSETQMESCQPALRRASVDPDSLAIGIAPWWVGALESTIEMAGELGCGLLVSSQILRTRPVHLFDCDSIGCSLSVLAEPLDFDEEVGGLVEEEIQGFEFAYDDVYLSIGVGTGSPLPEIITEGSRFPDWDYLTIESMGRIARGFRIHWGGNLPFSRVDWMCEAFPRETQGFFLCSTEAFARDSPNQVDFATMTPSGLPRAIRVLRDVCDCLDRRGNLDL